MCIELLTFGIWPQAFAIGYTSCEYLLSLFRRPGRLWPKQTRKDRLFIHVNVNVGDNRSYDRLLLINLSFASWNIDLIVGVKLAALVSSVCFLQTGKFR